MLKIWGRPNSTCTMKVLWTCEEAGLPFELILASATMGPQGHISRGPPYGVVDTPTYRAMNPNGTVPTIDEDGFILWESNTIVRYLARRHAPFLYGNDERTFALASQWMDWENQLVPFLHTLVMERVRLPPEGRTPESLNGALRGMEPLLQILENTLGKQTFLAGPAFSTADICLGANLARWFIFDLQRPGTPNLEAWMGKLRQRPAYQTHIADPSLHLA